LIISFSPNPIFLLDPQKFIQKNNFIFELSHQGDPGREKFQNEAKVKNKKILKRPRPSLFPRII